MTRIWRRRVIRLTPGLAALTLVAFGLLDLVFLPLPTEKLQRLPSKFIYSADSHLLTAFTSSDHYWRKPIALDQVSPHLIESVIAVEDRYFRYHPGINPVSLFSAAVANARAGRVVRGGSTLTMQIARMIEPKKRTVINKLFEMFRAIQLEIRYSKNELLEIYFNLAPYGGNIEGVGAAAYFYFDKEPSELTWSEAALLTAIPASPEKLRPDRNPKRAQQRRDRVLAILTARSIVTQDDGEAALAEKLPARRQTVPTTAPHFCQTLRARYPDSSTLISSLRYATQRLCEKLSRGHLDQLRLQGVHNLSIVVLDNATGNILALVGSPDQDDVEHAGQVNGALASRSPGSALKPFVYALAFDRSLLAPETKVADIPVDYSGYRPVNYDERYHGVVSVRTALVNSYNVPAVNAAAQLGLSSVHEFFRRGGLTTLNRPYYDYGLPLVLGSAEVRLLELANLYAALARGGVWKPTVDLRDLPNVQTRRLLSEGASYLITDILIGLKRPDLPSSWESTANRMPVAWKTGTSYGRRDAWAIGYTPRHTVGVWTGNFSGVGSVNLVGAKSAAPLMFDIFNGIESGITEDWVEPPADVSERSVCAVSGLSTSQFCSETEEELFLIGRSPAVKCSVHRPILIAKNTGLRLRARCTPGRDYDRRVVERWPARIASWLVAQGVAEPLPAYDPACLDAPDQDKPVIVSPGSGAVFELASDVPAEYQKITFEASGAGGGGTIHWFLDGQLYASSETDRQTFYAPLTGRHTLLCVDDQGRSDRADFVVR